MINKKHILNNRYFCKNDENYFIVKLNNKRFAIPDKCPHRGGPLSLGNICRESQRI
ncbi:TPA: Rieske 2Fe-2S domain-containing protein, partial [Legionella pneumophila]